VRCFLLTNADRTWHALDALVAAAESARTCATLHFRSAVNGSMRVPRNAGSQVATSATAPRNRAASTNVAESRVIAFGDHLQPHSSPLRAVPG
jgi:hypothetical protein